VSGVLVAVNGPPGSGKSSAGRVAAARLGLDYRSAGDLFRAEARRRGMDLAEFSNYAESHEEVDRALDEAMMALAVPGHLLDGRLQGPLCRRRGIPVTYVVVTARDEVRYARLAHRDGLPLEEAKRLAEARQESERARYLKIYGIDLTAERPDLTVDSSDISADEVADAIVQRVRGTTRPATT
jgi:cytidylate kinase